MAEVLVLVDHLDGEIKKSTFELLTAARALGEPSAVVVGPAGSLDSTSEASTDTCGVRKSAESVSAT